MRLTVKHHYDFGKNAELVGGSLLAPGSWDRVRLEAKGPTIDSAFALPRDRGEWIRRCGESAQVLSAARRIGDLVRSKGYSAVVSVGVGRACVEYHLKSLLPWIHLTCTELSPRVVEALKECFSECERIESFDIMSAHWPYVSDDTLYLLNRVDTELDDGQWEVVFRNMSRSGVRHALVIASGFVTMKMCVEEMVKQCRAVVSGRRMAFCGYLRTRAMFRTLWASQYGVEEEHLFGDLTGFLLRRSDS